MPARYILAILGSVGMAIIYGLKVNLSVAMVAMLNHTAIELLNENKTVAVATNVSISANQTLDGDCSAAAGSSDKVEVKSCQLNIIVIAFTDVEIYFYVDQLIVFKKKKKFNFHQ